MNLFLQIICKCIAVMFSLYSLYFSVQQCMLLCTDVWEFRVSFLEKVVYRLSLCSVMFVGAFKSTG